MESRLSESTNEFLRNILTCQVCKDLYRMPILLPCFHSFCQPCVSDRVTKEKRRTLWSLFGNKEKYVLDCVICKCVHNFSKYGMDTLVRNFLLENITDRYRERLGIKNIPKTCQLCEDRTNAQPAVKYCFKCDFSYCTTCMTDLHPPRLEQFAKHNVAEISRHTKLKCPEHHDLTLDFYCLQCHIPSCSACRTQTHHSNHRIVDIVGVYNEIEEMITSQGEKLARINAINKRFMYSVTTFQKTAKDGAEGLKQHIRNTCRELRQLIDAREMAMISTINTEVDSRLQKVTTKMSQVEEKWPVSEGLQKLTQELKVVQKDPASFLLFADDLRERLIQSLKEIGIVECDFSLTSPLGEWTMFNIASAKKMLESIRIARRLKPEPPQQTPATSGVSTQANKSSGKGDKAADNVTKRTDAGNQVSRVATAQQGTGRGMDKNNKPSNMGSKATAEKTSLPAKRKPPILDNTRQSKQSDTKATGDGGNGSLSSPTLSPTEFHTPNVTPTPTPTNFGNTSSKPPHGASAMNPKISDIKTSFQTAATSVSKQREETRDGKAVQNKPKNGSIGNKSHTDIRAAAAPSSNMAADGSAKAPNAGETKGRPLPRQPLNGSRDTQTTQAAANLPPPKTAQEGTIARRKSSEQVPRVPGKALNINAQPVRAPAQSLRGNHSDTAASSGNNPNAVDVTPKQQTSEKLSENTNAKSNTNDAPMNKTNTGNGGVKNKLSHTFSQRVQPTNTKVQSSGQANKKTVRFAPTNSSSTGQSIRNSKSSSKEADLNANLLQQRDNASLSKDKSSKAPCLLTITEECKPANSRPAGSVQNAASTSTARHHTKPDASKCLTSAPKEGHTANLPKADVPPSTTSDNSSNAPHSAITNGNQTNTTIPNSTIATGRATNQPNANVTSAAAVANSQRGVTSRKVVHPTTNNGRAAGKPSHATASSTVKGESVTIQPTVPPAATSRDTNQPKFAPLSNSMAANDGRVTGQQSEKASHSALSSDCIVNQQNAKVSSSATSHDRATGHQSAKVVRSAVSNGHAVNQANAGVSTNPTAAPLPLTNCGRVATVICGRVAAVPNTKIPTYICNDVRVPANQQNNKALRSSTIHSGPTTNKPGSGGQANNVTNTPGRKTGLVTRNTNVNVTSLPIKNGQATSNPSNEMTPSPSRLPKASLSKTDTTPSAANSGRAIPSSGNVPTPGPHAPGVRGASKTGVKMPSSTISANHDTGKQRAESQNTNGQPGADGKNITAPHTVSSRSTVTIEQAANVGRQTQNCPDTKQVQGAVVAKHDLSSGSTPIDTGKDKDNYYEEMIANLRGNDDDSCVEDIIANIRQNVTVEGPLLRRIKNMFHDTFSDDQMKRMMTVVPATEEELYFRVAQMVKKASRSDETRYEYHTKNMQTIFEHLLKEATGKHANITIDPDSIEAGYIDLQSDPAPGSGSNLVQGVSLTESGLSKQTVARVSKEGGTPLPKITKSRVNQSSQTVDLKQFVRGGKLSLHQQVVASKVSRRDHAQTSLLATLSTLTSGEDGDKSRPIIYPDNIDHKLVQTTDAGEPSTDGSPHVAERGWANQRSLSVTRNARRHIFDGGDHNASGEYPREHYQYPVGRLARKDLEGGPVLLNLDGSLTAHKTEEKEPGDKESEADIKTEIVEQIPTKVRKTTAISFVLDTHTLHEDLVLTEDHKTVERKSCKPKNLPFAPKKIDKEGVSIAKIPTTGRFIAWSPTVLGDVAMTSGEYYWEVYGTRISYTDHLDNDLCSFGVTVGDCPRNALLCSHPTAWCFHVYKAGFEGHYNRINQSVCTKFAGGGHDGDRAIHVGVLLSFSDKSLSYYDLQDNSAPSRLRKYENICNGPLYPAFSVTSLNYQLTVINGMKLPKVLRQQIRKENEEKAKRLREKTSTDKAEDPPAK